MLRNWKRLTTVPLLATTLWVAGCSDLAQTDRLIGPESASFAKGGKSAEKKGGKGRVVKGRKADGSASAWQIATGALPTTDNDSISARGIIGAGGGHLQLPGVGHVLYVPGGAVTQPTQFKLTQIKQRLPDGSVEVIVQLKAFAVANGVPTATSVGERGFNTPVYLGLSYAWASEVSDGNAAHASILYLKGADTAEPQRTFTVDYGQKWVVAELWHFSDYGLSFPAFD